MDIQQLRSWIFELYEPLEDERQYIVFDPVRGNLMIDVPPFSERAVRLIRGTGRTALVLATNAARAAEAARFREVLGIQIAVHRDDAAAVPRGPDVALGDEELVRPDARVVRVSREGEGATVVLVRRAGGVLFCGDLDLGSEAAKDLLHLEFSSVLAARRPPIWSAGKETLMRLQRELPKPAKRFSILVPPPWDRAYKGRLENKMYHHEVIVPAEATAPHEAAMGPATLVVARQTRALIERTKRPMPVTSAPGGDGAATPPAPARASTRPRNFAEDWGAPETPHPPTTLANAAATIETSAGVHRPRPLGERFRRLSIDEVAGSPYVDWRWGGIDPSPDGAEVAFAWNRSGAFEIYSAPLDRDRLFQLTEAKERSVSPRWAPDGKTLAFLRDRAGDERFDIWLVDRDGERERNLTREPAVCHREIEWSPDGSRIAYTANAGGDGFAVHVLDVETGATRALTFGAHDDHDPRWSPDGRTILFWSRRETSLTDADLYLVPAAGGPVSRLDTRGGVAGESTDGRWSPDGSRVAFTTDIHGRSEVAIADLVDGAVTRVEPLTTTIHDESEGVWRPDARALLYLHTEDAEVQARRVFVVSHADHGVADRPGVHAWLRVGADSDLVAFLYSGAREPWNVYVTRERMTAPRALTRSLPATVDPAVLVEPVHVRYTGSDGREIPALLYVPHAEAVRGPMPPPAIVHLHGGPDLQHLRWWDAASQWFANSGYVVLAPNIRGSTGYGREFTEANRGDWGGTDLDDVVRGVDWLAKEGIADPRRVGMYGRGYGGFLTTMALSAAPDRFAAGVSVSGVASWPTMYDTTRGDVRQQLARELGDPERDAERYRDRSPLTHVARMRAPLLVLHGASDARVTVDEAERLVAALRSARKTHEYHLYAGEGHSFGSTENMIDAVRRTTDWFDLYLQPRA